MRFDITRARLVYGLVILFCAALYLADIRGVLERAREDVTFAVAPSAQRAYDYGARHFDAMDAREYDLNRTDRVWGFPHQWHILVS